MLDMEWLNGTTRTARSLIFLGVMAFGIWSAGAAFGGWLATRGIKEDIAAVDNDVAAVQVELRAHTTNPALHVVTSTELQRINRRLCLLMSAQGIADADCPAGGSK